METVGDEASVGSVLHTAVHTGRTVRQHILINSAADGSKAGVSVLVMPVVVFKYGNSTVSCYIPVESTTYSTLTTPFRFTNAVSTIDGYTPKNNKLKVAPYNYFTLSNNAGQTTAFKFEDFKPDTYFPNDSIPRFAVVGALTEGGQIKCYPINYKLGTSDSKSQWDYGISGYQYPTLSWLSDYYLNWRARNSQYIDFQNKMFALQVGGQFMSSVF